MTLEELFYKEVCPEGKNNYVLSGQAKVLLMLCKAIDEMKAAEPSVQADKCPACGGAKTVLSSFGGFEDCVECGGTGIRR